MTDLDRRRFLARAAGLAGAAVFAPSLRGLAAHGERLARVASMDALRAGVGSGAYGPLAAAGPELELPEGFTYVRFGVEGDPMSDGAPTPGMHDGMAAFPRPDGVIRLIRNHELGTIRGAVPLVGDPARAYDRKASGGTVSLDVRVEDGRPELARDFVSLNGTMVNCAGGPTPWGSWLSCEEITVGVNQGYEREHGYIFEVSAGAEAEVDATPLRAMGRFIHEAVAVDPDTGIVYETEDVRYAPAAGLPGSGFYRYVPDRPGELAAGGRLQMLAVRDRPRYDTTTGQWVGDVLPAAWVDIDDPDPPDSDRRPSAVFLQGWAAGGARFQRLEGAWWGDGGVYFHATSGGDARRGQVWHYRPGRGEGGELVLIFESPAREMLDHPDNVTVSPRGGVLICEDGSGDQYLRGLAPDGRIFDFAKNIADTTEFAGACYSPNGRILFVNIQGRARQNRPGMTMAITGPWELGAL